MTRTCCRLEYRSRRTINQIRFLRFYVFFFFFFFTRYQLQRKYFSFRERAAKSIGRRENHGLDLLIFDWLVLSMRMQVILDSIFARTGLALKGAGRKESSGAGLVHFWLPVY